MQPNQLYLPLTVFEVIHFVSKRYLCNISTLDFWTSPLSLSSSLVIGVLGLAAAGSRLLPLHGTLMHCGFGCDGAIASDIDIILYASWNGIAKLLVAAILSKIYSYVEKSGLHRRETDNRQKWHRLWQSARQKWRLVDGRANRPDSGSHRVFVFHISRTAREYSCGIQIGTWIIVIGPRIGPNALETGSKSGHGRHNHVSVYFPSLTSPQFQKTNRSRIRHVVLRAPFECSVPDTFLLHMAFVAFGTLWNPNTGSL